MSILLKYLGVVVGSGLFALGAAKTLLTGLASGEFHGKNGVVVATLHGGPVKFLVFALFLAAASAGFAWLTYSVFRQGPQGLAQAERAQGDEQRQARKQAARARRPAQWPYVVATVLFIASAVLAAVAAHSRGGSAGYLTLFSALYAVACAIGGVIALMFSPQKRIALTAMSLLGLLMVLSVFFK